MASRMTYLVIEPFRVIAQDLALSITDFDSTGDVRIVPTLVDAEPVLEQIETVTLALVNADPAHFPQTRLASILAAHRAKIVLIGDAAENANAKAGFPVLHRPYAPEAVIALMARVLTDQAQA